MTPPFQESFAELFEAEFHRLFRYLDRLSGEPELATDIAQEAFVRLHQRGAMPDRPEAWLITVALNLFRNARSMSARRRRLLTAWRAEAVVADPPLTPAQATDAQESTELVRAALDQLAEREQQLLLLCAEGYSYRDIAGALRLNEGSVGTLLGRAKRAFRKAYQGNPDAS
jgi:RNA polymerase sigma-70 factor (ECF subfamily)